MILRINEMFYDWMKHVVDRLVCKSSDFSTQKISIPTLTICSDFGFYNKRRISRKAWGEAIGKDTHCWKKHEIFTAHVLNKVIKNDQ